MENNFRFAELGDAEKKVLLSAFGYSVDENGVIFDSLMNEPVPSPTTRKPILLKDAALVPGSLKMLDSDPLSISRYLREEIEKQ